MIKQKLAIIAASVALVASVAVNSNAALALDFANVSGASIQFGPGSQFSFNPTIGNTANPLFVITTAGSTALGFKGWINGGPWSIGAITSPVAGVQNATVTGPGATFVINDGVNNLVGNVNWGTITTVFNAGAVNAAFNVNITGLTYSGLNADLLNLANGKSGALTLTFQFAAPGALSDLVASGGRTTSFSGTITSIPEPSTVVAGALLLLPFGVSTVRILRKNRAS